MPVRERWNIAARRNAIVAGLLTILLRFPRLSAEQRAMRVQVWSREMLARLGIRLEVQGDAGGSRVRIVLPQRS